MTEIIKIERMSYGADAIGRLASGKTIFVASAVPGDIVEVQIVEDKPRFARGIITSIIEPSLERVRVDDSLPSTIAPWAALSYELQLSSKQDNVYGALLRTAHLDSSFLDSIFRPIIKSQSPISYRNKIELACQNGNHSNLELGFRDEFGKFVAFHGKSLAIGNSLLSGAPKALTGALRRILGNDDFGLFRVGMRASEITKSIEVAFWTTPGAWPRAFSSKVIVDATRATSIVRVIADKGKSRKIKRIETLDGDGFWREKIDDANFHVQAPSFFQVNTSGAQQLVKIVIERLADFCERGAEVADLYSGVGTFTIPLVQAGAEVVAVELAGSSARDFEYNCKLNDVYADIICDDASLALPLIGDVDALVVDPPKSGLNESVVNQIVDLRPEKIIYVSCDPQTLARDIKRFADQSYIASFVQPVDMFAQTWHVETVVELLPE